MTCILLLLTGCFSVPVFAATDAPPPPFARPDNTSQEPAKNPSPPPQTSNPKEEPIAVYNIPPQAGTDHAAITQDLQPIPLTIPDIPVMEVSAMNAPAPVVTTETSVIETTPVTGTPDENTIAYPDMAESNGEYNLGAGDKVKITIFGEPDLSGDFKLGGDGTISMPLIGVVSLNGLGLRQAEALIETRLKDGYLKNPSVAVEVIESRPFYILGEVRRPGSYNYINGMTALEAVAISGGFTYRANRKKIDILRRGTVNAEPQSFEPETFIRAGDILFVRERFF